MYVNRRINIQQNEHGFWPSVSQRVFETETFNRNGWQAQMPVYIDEEFGTTGVRTIERANQTL